MRIPPRPSPLAAPQPKPTAAASQNATKAAATSAPAATDTAASATAVAERFYGALAKGDTATMAQSYAPNAVFHDPLFGYLNGPQISEMWNTIVPAADPKTFSVQPRVVGEPVQQRDGSWKVQVHWDASYDLPGKTHVNNHADSTLIIKNGRIVSQRDEWDLAKWTQQALPFGGGSMLGDALAKVAAHGAIRIEDFLSLFKR